MTTREDKRFTAAVAAMQGLVTQGWSSSVRGNMSIEHVAIEIADALISKLEETAPPAAEDKECIHLWDNFSYGSVCQKCGAFSP